MPFEVLWDGYVRRFTVLAPQDWMSEVELEGASLPLFVFVWPGRVFDLTDAVDNILEPGSPRASGALAALRPVAGNPTGSLDPLAPLDQLQWPKFVGLFVEGIDPTGQASRPFRNLSGSLEPHDLGPFEVLYTATDARAGDIELLKSLITSVSDQLDATWDAWYAGIKTRTIPVVDPDKVFLVGFAQGATFALEALADPVFHGAALIMPDVGGSFGGDKVRNPDVVGREVRPPAPPPDPKAILAIVGNAAHLGIQGEDARVDVPGPSRFSAADLAENGEWPVEVVFDTRQEFTVLGSLLPWWEAMGHPAPRVSLWPIFGSVMTRETGVAGAGYVRIWHDAGFREALAGTYVPMTEIFKFFRDFG